MEFEYNQIVTVNNSTGKVIDILNDKVLIEFWHGREWIEKKYISIN
jgi:hypothetical protein